MEVIKIKDLKALVKRSEEHARECPLEYGTSPMCFNHRITKGYLSIVVTSNNVGRAAKVFGDLIKYLYDRSGYSFTVDNDSFYHQPPSAIIVDDIAIPIRIKEKEEMRINVKGKYPHRFHMATGRLSIEIYSSTSVVASPKAFVVPTNGGLEERFDEIAKYLKQASERLKDYLAKELAWHMKQEEERQQREDHLDRLQQREDAVLSVFNDMELYMKAQMIRKYCSLAQTMFPTAEYQAKTSAALEIADWIDPTIDYTDELDEITTPEDISEKISSLLFGY